jgi:hypothetical protein
MCSIQTRIGSPASLAPRPQPALPARSAYCRERAQLWCGAELIASKELYEDFIPHLQVRLETIEEDWIPNAARRIERSPNERLSNDVRPRLLAAPTHSRAQLSRKRTGGRRAARCHSLNHFAQPATESPGAVGARTEPYRSSDARPKLGITEHENKEIGGSEQRLFQLRGPSSFVVEPRSVRGQESGRAFAYASPRRRSIFSISATCISSLRIF